MSECPDGRFDAFDGGCIDTNVSEYRKNILCDKFVVKQQIRTCKDLNKSVEAGRCARKYVPTKPSMMILDFF